MWASSPTIKCTHIYNSFESRNISVCLHLTREVAKVEDFWRRERKTHHNCNGYFQRLPLSHLRCQLPWQGEPCFKILSDKDFCASVGAFECENIAASLSLTRESARRNAVTEREQNNNKFVFKIVIIWFLSLKNIRDDVGIVPYVSFESKKSEQASPLCLRGGGSTNVESVGIENIGWM